MQDKIRINTLLDYYGGLLTAKQQEICRFYYREDLSLQEISEILDISRAAVHDTVKRVEKDLLHYEEILCCVSLSEKRNSIYELICNKTDDQEILDLVNQCKHTEIEGGNYE
ncbi:MAG: HTH domain-containing protein [Solobacterium sp.]|nr:HTH domain-containing protein [Solobacterium sp.]